MKRPLPSPLRHTAVATAAAHLIAAALLTGPAQAAPASDSAPTSTGSDCTALPPLPTPPPPGHPTRHELTRYGAIGDDDRPDDAAFERALAALKPGDWLVLPPGRYLQAGPLRITVPGVTVWGPGATLHALSAERQTFALAADGVRLIGLRLTAVTDRRRGNGESVRLTIGPGRSANGAEGPVEGNLVRGVTIESDAARGLPHGGSSGGIGVFQASRFTIAENRVRDTLADGIHVTSGSHDGRIVANEVSASGDDAIATVSYLGEDGLSRLRAGQEPIAGRQVHDVLIQANRVGGNAWGRGIGIVGSRRITVRSNSISGVGHAAGVLVAQEGSYHTPGPSEVLIEDNDLREIQTGSGFPPLRPRTGHGAIEIHTYGNPASDIANPWVASRLALRGVTLRGNRIEGAGADGIRVGAGSQPGMVGEVRLLGNTVRGQRGQAIALALPGAVSLQCPPGDTASPGCAAALAERDLGARLDCSRLP